MGDQQQQQHQQSFSQRNILSQPQQQQQVLEGFGLNRVPSLSGMQFAQINQPLHSTYGQHSSSFPNFYAPPFNSQTSVVTSGAQQSDVTPTTNTVSPPPGYLPVTPSLQTLSKHPSMGRIDSYQHLKLLMDEEVHKRKAQGTFNFAGGEQTLLPTNSYLCMKSIIEDDFARKGITLPTKNTSQAVQNLLEEDRSKWAGNPSANFNRLPPQLRSTYAISPTIPNQQIVSQPQRQVQQNKPTKPQTKKAKGAKGKSAKAGGDKIRRTSEYRGVSFHTSSGNWRARIKIHGQSKHLGYFKDEHAAAEAYDQAALRLYGENAPNNRILREKYKTKMEELGVPLATSEELLKSKMVNKAKSKSNGKSRAATQKADTSYGNGKNHPELSHKRKAESNSNNTWSGTGSLDDHIGIKTNKDLGIAGPNHTTNPSETEIEIRRKRLKTGRNLAKAQHHDDSDSDNSGEEEVVKIL